MTVVVVVVVVVVVDLAAKPKWKCHTGTLYICRSLNSDIQNPYLIHPKPLGDWFPVILVFFYNTGDLIGEQGTRSVVNPL